MSYKRNIFNDKTIIGAAAVGVLAVSAIVGGALLSGRDDNGLNNAPIVDLSEETTLNGNNFADSEETTDREQGIVVSDQNQVVAEKPDDKKNVESEDKPKEEESTSKEDETELRVPDTENTDVSSNLIGMNFDAHSTLVWPVEGNVIIDFDMDNTVYFATLDLYKCSDAVCIQAEVGTPVYAGHNCVIEEIAYDSEIGNNVTVSMGNGYMLTYGQLKDVQVERGDYMEEGELIGYIGNPTKYYTLEGSHLYMKMTNGGEAVDPLEYLNYSE